MSAVVDMKGIDKLPSGRFRLRMQVGGKKLNGVYATLEEAVQTRDAAKRDLADGLAIPAEGESLFQLGPKFLRRREGNRNIRTDTGRWDNHIATSDFAHRPVVTITRRDVLDWLDDLKVKQNVYNKAKQGDRGEGTLKWGTRKHCLNLLRRFFVYCVDRGLMQSNPALDVVVEREDGDEEDGYQEGWYLAIDEQHGLVAKAHALAKISDERENKRTGERVDIRELDIILFSMWTGLRLNEAWCLHLVDVHVDGTSPHILVKYGSWDAKNQRYRSPKGKKGEKKTRRVDLYGEGLAAAKRWLANLPEYTDKNKYGLMFPSPFGGRRTKAPHLFKKLQKAFTVDRLQRPIWWHLLRHTCASSMVAGWWGKRWFLEDVRGYLGHSSVKVTEQYAHLIPSVATNVAAEAHAAWASCHDVVMPLGMVARKPLKNSARPAGIEPATRGLEGRVNHGKIREKHGVHDNLVTTAVTLLQRCGEGQAVSTREWVDVVCALVDALEAATADKSTTEQAAGGARKRRS